MLENGDFWGSYNELLSKVEISKNKYWLPLSVEDIVGIYKPMNSPEHSGEFAPAVDFAILDPRIRETKILAPCDGIVRAGRLGNTIWGEDKTFVQYLNWVNIDTCEGEFYELAHISPIRQRVLRVGDRIKKGEIIAIAGLNGRMTTTDGIVDSHVHMFVGKTLTRGAFKGLRINWGDLSTQ